MARKKKSGKRTGSMMYDALFYDHRSDKLSPSAFKLLIELNQQFDGFNNGNLCAARKCLRFNWNEKTLKKAKRELLAGYFIEVTRQGVKRRPTLYALCHLSINEIQKHGIKAKENCSFRATGKRSNFYPVRKDLRENLRNALDASKKIGG